MLRHGHCRKGRRRRRSGGVRSGYHHDGARQPRRTQIVLEELAHLPPALADQGEHRDIACGMTCQHGQQARFANAGAGEHPSLCPWRQVAKQLSARTPTSRRGPRRARNVASGGRARTRRAAGPAGSAPCASSGRPSGSSTRPSQASDTTRSRRSACNGPRPEPGGAAGTEPSRAPNGIACASPWRKPTISAGMLWPSRAARSRPSPTQTCPLSPSISTTRPDSPLTRPSICSGAMSRKAARPAAAAPGLWYISLITINPTIDTIS